MARGASAAAKGTEAGTEAGEDEQPCPAQPRDEPCGEAVAGNADVVEWYMITNYVNEKLRSVYSQLEDKPDTKTIIIAISILSALQCFVNFLIIIGLVVNFMRQS